MEEVVRVEEKDYFYNDTVIFTAENVSGLQMRFVEDLVYNKINIGYQKWETEDHNGLDEPLTKREYVYEDIESIKNDIDLLSPYVCGMYAIELTRRKDYIRFATTDTRYDEDGFFIALNRSVDANNKPTGLDTAEKDENFSSVADLISSDTAYNLRFSIAKNFLRLFNILSTGLTKLTPSKIKVANSEGNIAMQSTQLSDGCKGDNSGVLLIDGNNIIYPKSTARDDAPLWLPEEYTFEYPVNRREYAAIRANPNGVVEFTNSGITYGGYIQTLEYNLLTSMATFTLIRKYD